MLKNRRRRQRIHCGSTFCCLRRVRYRKRAAALSYADVWKQFRNKFLSWMSLEPFCIALLRSTQKATLKVACILRFPHKNTQDHCAKTRLLSDTIHFDPLQVRGASYVTDPTKVVVPMLFRYDFMYFPHLTELEMGGIKPDFGAAGCELSKHHDGFGLWRHRRG